MLTLNFSPFPDLQTKRLALSEITNNDAADIFRLRSNAIVMQYFDRPHAKDINEAMELVRKIQNGIINNEAITWKICLKNHTKLIGTIGFWRIMKEHHRAEIGYLLDPDHHRKGLMNEALEATLVYAFEVIQLHSVEANTNPANEASAKILLKHHFKKEALFKENFLFNNKYIDSEIYSLLGK